MKNKLFPIIMAGVLLCLLLPFVSSQIYQKNSEVDLKVPCLNNNTYCSSTAMCNITIFYPNASVLIANGNMTNQFSFHNYSLKTWQTSEIGEYITNVICLDGIEKGSTSFTFKINYLGKELTEGQSTLYLGLLALLVLLFVLNFVGMGFLPSKNIRDEEGRIMQINYLKYFRNVLWMTGYFLFIAIMYISSNLAFAFLEEELVAQTLFVIYRMAFIIAPVVLIVWIVWIFASIFHDKQFQSLINRGFFPGERL